MNCKPGDLAIVVKSSAGNEGKIVTCVRLVAGVIWVGRDGRENKSPTWEIDRPLAGWAGDLSAFIEDSQLRPIRDNDGEDEMIRIAGLPHKEIA